MTKKWQIYLKQFSYSPQIRFKWTDTHTHTHTHTLTNTHAHTCTHTPTNAIGENTMHFILLKNDAMLCYANTLWDILEMGKTTIHPNTPWHHGDWYNPSASPPPSAFHGIANVFDSKLWLFQWRSRRRGFGSKLTFEHTLSTCICHICQFLHTYDMCSKIDTAKSSHLFLDTYSCDSISSGCDKVQPSPSECDERVWRTFRDTLWT